MKKIALATALILGTATAAFAEDSSSSFGIDVYAQAAQRQQHQTLTSRNVALRGGQSAIVRSQAEFDRASNPAAGGGY